MKLILPLPPTINKCYPSNRGGRRYKSTEYKGWIENCDMLLVGREQKKLVFEGYGIIIKLVFFTKWLNKNGTVRKADVDNRIKAVLDYLPRYIDDFDDCYVWKMVATKMHSGRDEVEIEIVETKRKVCKKIKKLKQK